MMIHLPLLVLASVATASAETVYPNIFVGGVSGIDALATPANSDGYRADGGGLYLHHSGWSPLSAATKSSIQSVFSGQDVVVEIGFNGSAPAGWVSAYLANYHDLGIRPVFVTCNAFASGNLPTTNQWANWINAFRNAGVDTRTLILPTFEYQNFAQNVATLSNNKVSQRADFQAIITMSGGIVLDTPSNYFFAREQAYRDWVIDAIQWVQSQNFTAVVIISPHTAGNQYNESTANYVTYLKNNDALPNMFSVENYSTADPATYVNRVGSEDVPDEQLGCARLLQTQMLPGAVGRTSDYDGDGLTAAQETALSRSDYDVANLGFSFDVNGNFQGWGGAANISGLAVSGGSLVGTTTSADPNVTRSGLYFDGGRIKDLIVNMQASAVGTVQIYWGVNNGATVEGPITASYSTANAFATLRFPMSSHARWKNKSISSIRIDPISAASASFQINWVIGSNGDFDYDTYTDVQEGFSDTDGDGVANAFDTDSDGDGMSDFNESLASTSPTQAFYDFNMAGNLQGWTPANVNSPSVSGGSLNGTAANTDPTLVRQGVSFSGNSFKQVQVRMKASNSSTVQLFWGIAGANNFTASRSATANYTTPNAWQLVTFNMASVPAWTGNLIQSLRVDPTSTSGTTFNIDYIRVVP